MGTTGLSPRTKVNNFHTRIYVMVSWSSRGANTIGASDVDPVEAGSSAKHLQEISIIISRSGQRQSYLGMKDWEDHAHY